LGKGSGSIPNPAYSLLRLTRPKQWIKNSFVLAPLIFARAYSDVSARSGGRKVLKEYSVTLVDRYAEMSAMGALLFYSLFVMSTNPGLAGTIPLVLFGMFRYWYVVETPTDVLLTDWPLIACILIWGAICVYALKP
jgi:4-hydroxybenzoate polyprenyltransferase